MNYLTEMFQLHGKVLAVVGGTRDLGSAVAGALAKTGAHTAFIYQENQ